MLDVVENLRTLPNGWDGDAAEAPNDTAIAHAHRVLDILKRLNFHPDRIAPSAEGGVTISFFVERRYGDIELFNTGEILAVTSDGSGNPHVWEVPDEEAAIRNALEQIRTMISPSKTQSVPTPEGMGLAHP
jgi:hypothetical protein